MYLFSVCWDESPVKLIDVFYVSKQSTHLLGPDGEGAQVNNVCQIILWGEKLLKVNPNGTTDISRFLPAEGACLQ